MRASRQHEQANTPDGWRDLFAEGRLPRIALILLGIWLNAADTLVIATIMPSVGRDLGGLTFFSWAVAGFLMGAILAGASAGRLSERLGLSRSSALAGFTYAVGCVISALAPGMGLFLAGRVLQGIGGGWIAGFAMVAAALLFPERHLARVFAAVSGVWGVATVLGPLVGGVLAELGDWRAVFWLFALQSAAFALVAPWLLKGTAPRDETGAVPGRQLLALGVGVGAVAIADVSRSPLGALVLVVAGLAVLVGVVRLDERAKVRLLPRGSSDLRTICGAGYAAMFGLTASSMPLTVYGPALLQQLRGLSPLWAGYVIGVEALVWTLAAFAVSGVSSHEDRPWIRRGAVCIVIGVAMLAKVMRDDPLLWVLVATAILGAGFGMCSTLMNRRLIAALGDEDRAIGSSAVIAVRQTGGATGAAIAGASANLVGFSAGLTRISAEHAAVWVFVTALPLAVLGLLAAWRFSGSARSGDGPE